MNTRARIVTLTVTVLLVACAGQAAAATLTVTTFDDLSGPGDGRCSLREAIAAVDSPGTAGSDCESAAFGANTIVIPAGTYPVASHFDPTTQEMGELVIAPTVTSLTIAGAGEGKTTIGARPDLTDRLLRVSAGATVTIKDLTLTGGRAQFGNIGSNGTGDGGGQGASGGAILNAGSLTLIDSAVANSSAGQGGRGGVGVGSVATGGPGGDGGAGGYGGGIYNTGSLTLQGSTIAGNSAGAGGGGGAGGDGTSTGGKGGAGGSGGQGGGVANAGGTLTVLDSTFNGNSAGDGGRGGDGGQGPTGEAGGNGGGAAGGGAIVSTGGTVTITDSTFASNSAGNGQAGGSGGSAATGGNGGVGGNGGGIEVLGLGSASLQSVTIAGNSAGDGGAGGSGGSGPPAAAAGTVGQAGVGGGIVSQGTATTVQNSVLASNTGGNCSASVLDSGNNLTFAGGGCPATFATGDPNLGPLQDNGGPAQTISLAPGSAAIDKVPSTGAGCPTTDERGVHRPVGSGCDVGAYEVAPPMVTTGRTKAVTATGATLTASVTPNAGAASVQFQFGTSKKYKSKTAVQHIGGVVPVTVTAKLGHLRQRTTYHYRVTIVALDGTSEGQDRTFKTTNRPTLSGLSVKPGAFAASGAGATIRYSDSVAATTTFTVLRCTKPLAHGARCARFVKVGSFSHRDRAGRNTVPLRARIGRATLSPGFYKLQARARAGRKTGNTVTAKFQIRA